MVRALQPVNAHSDCKLPADPEMVPLQGERVVSVPICANKVRNGPASVDQGCVLQPAKAAAMRTGCCDYASHLPLYPTFFASAKLIFKMYCAK